MDELIFSKDRYRFLRHLIFWLVWLIFASIVQLTGFHAGPIPFDELITNQIYRSLTRIPSHLLFCYTVIYFLIPHFIPAKKYLRFSFFFLLFILLLYMFNYYLLTPTYRGAGFIDGVPHPQVPLTPFIRKFYSFYSNINFTGAIPACCGMLAIKYYKDWHIRQMESETLIRENKQAELQLLKAQIHPHFLFNTLNNIYSFTLTGSPQAEGLVNKLSGMVEYIISEGEKNVVPLEKEIQFINDYVGLEKVRYGDRLNMQVAIKGSYKNNMIAPLLMIPFVENCFKHGASIMRGQQWIKLNISIYHNQLDFKVGNSKPVQSAVTINHKGIGLANVKKRLQLLYPENHFLKITSTEDTYTVHLRVTINPPALSEMNHTITTKLHPV